MIDHGTRDAVQLGWLLLAPGPPPWRSPSTSSCADGAGYELELPDSARIRTEPTDRLREIFTAPVDPQNMQRERSYR